MEFIMSCQFPKIFRTMTRFVPTFILSARNVSVSKLFGNYTFSSTPKDPSLVYTFKVLSSGFISELFFDQTKKIH